MELKRRLDTVIKQGEAAIGWNEEEGYTLSFKEENVPEEVILMLAFVDRYCNDDESVDNLLDWFDSRCEANDA